ncbi:helix-turn-helix domain-containing protein [Clostridium intestinale]|jgi:excisionase family DNA binding protein|uniref:helix-turn-helix domain-containing protein n=1 Tax=Clostridium intestinale TaxID=36845 RepID=UPI0028E60F3D|nr:helix-turn-helix domain-containing protein [Clostridium intestinale]
MKYNSEIKKTLAVKEFAEIYNIGINKAYEMVNAKGFPMIRTGKKIIIIASKVDEWFFNQIGNTF